MKKYGIMIIACLSVMLGACGFGPDPGTNKTYHARGVDAYDKSVIMEKYGSDLDSDLSIFPDEITTEEAQYRAHLNPNLFDTDGTIILECTYSDDAYAAEIDRLKGLSKTIKYNGEQYTNQVLYDEDMYSYPAYITIDGFGDTYEYALVDQKEKKIEYLYLAYPKVDALVQYREYLKKDLKTYAEEEKPGAYTMYLHSFDGGEVYIEFSDDY